MLLKLALSSELTAESYSIVNLILYVNAMLTLWLHPTLPYQAVAFASMKFDYRISK